MAEGGADAETPSAGKMSLPMKIAYGFGSVAFGVKRNGFDYFLMLFYSQVVGLDARLVGLALTTALVFDALSDPIIGYWSDNLHTRWGRRHPFMYIAALPVSLSYFLLWNPPDWSQAGLFWFLLLTAVCIRTFVTLYETPSSALIPELSESYDERSSLVSFRYFFGWTGGNTMTVMMFLFLFPAMATEAIPDGRFNPASYHLLGGIGAGLILLSIMVSSLGTHPRIPHLKAPPPKRALTLKRVFREIFETLSERSFIALFLSAIFGAVASGLAAALSFYFYTYFWEFTSRETGVLTLGVFVSAFIGLTLAPVVTRRMDKKRGAMIVGVIAVIGLPLPILLRVLGLLPDNDSPIVFWFVLIATVIDVGLIICFQILTTSMMADLVEKSELQTGRRSEGIFFSATTFITKSVQGFGILAASLVLTLAQFPSGASVEEVPAEAIWRLGAFYVPAVLLLWGGMMLMLSRYQLSRSDHEENLRQLSRQKLERSEAG